MVIPSARRTGAAWRKAGWSSGANMNTIPVSASTSAIPSGESSIATPSDSSTSALPHFEVNERLPCLATRTPPAAATMAAAVEMLKVETVPPPVPQVSTSVERSSARTGIMAACSASTPPAISEGASPLVWRAARRAPVWIGEAWPETMCVKATRASADARSSPATALARRGGNEGEGGVGHGDGGWGDVRAGAER